MSSREMIFGSAQNNSEISNSIPMPFVPPVTRAVFDCKPQNDDGGGEGTENSLPSLAACIGDRTASE